MPARATIRMCRCVTAWAAALMIAALTTAFVRPPPPVDAGMVERAVAGAEWLAARVGDAPEKPEPASAGTSLTDWLLDAGGGAGMHYEAFAEHLATIGYEDPLFAVQAWIEELPRVIAAADAARAGTDMRPLSDIEREIRSLPTVPLDEAGEAERDRLTDEFNMAATPEAHRRAAAAAAERIEALRALAGLGDTGR